MDSHTYSEATLPSAFKPQTIQTYRWIPPTTNAAVFLLHGFRSHARFNFLRNDLNDSLHKYGTEAESSFIRELNSRNLAVFAHDHVGHGRSTGLRAYFPSFQTLVDDTLAHVRAVDSEFGFTNASTPIFLIGHSMGGTISIITARDNPTLFAGVALSSAATEPPANMFGLVGKIQRSLSGITSVIIPTAQLVALPKSIDADMEALYRSDPENCTEGIRARVGREMLNAYQDISSRIQEVSFPFLAAYGEFDTLVNPTAATRFCEKSSSTDKTLQCAAGRWHNLFAEKGREDMWKMFVEWVAARI